MLVTLTMCVMSTLLALSRTTTPTTLMEFPPDCVYSQLRVSLNRSKSVHHKQGVPIPFCGSRQTKSVDVIYYANSKHHYPNDQKYILNGEFMTEIKEKVCSFGELYKAMHECKKNVMWKTSVAGYVKNGLVNCYKLHNQLMDDTYKIDKYSYFTITEPKVRDIVSTRMKDRVFQRSLCDNYLYEKMTKGLIYDNAACQIGGGTDFSMDRLTRHMQKYFKEYGVEGYVLQCDIKGFFGNTRHSVAKDVVNKRVDDEWVKGHVFKVIESYGTKEHPNMGMGLGSQVTQLVQLAILDDLDHYIKEELGIKLYSRYMDDFILVHHDKEYLKYCRAQIEKKLAVIHLRLNVKKTQLFPLRHGIKYLGFIFYITDTGKVIKKLQRENVTDQRKKLRKLKGLVDQGILTKEHVNKIYESWQSHAKKGNTYTLRRNMDQYYKSLWITGG